MAEELKDQRVPIMMSPSELKALDDWMFKSRLRSRGEAIRRLVQVGIAAEENFPTLADCYVDMAGAAMNIAVRGESDEEAMAVLAQVHAFGQLFGKLRATILTMRGAETIESALRELDEVMQAYRNQNPDMALDLMKAFLERSWRDRRPAAPEK